ncbi:hypothetical protein LTR78_008796 [Recurvomyces mirabilis]|uniref:YDG domain-containing protein n=1 Tax=Recurvomyces mirabilis TaxID=574656 RepID=A0AAE0WIV7_9PEZI|nr:hypothetical protein LTR78_008796 [Recurvomyces mirabilis]KAK5160966.1 hypothetical protein LTS14_000760 [Recurvomyces mirabilis]
MQTLQTPAIRGVRTQEPGTPMDGRISVYNIDFLRHRARWIRDDLDPRVAREGGDALHADEILKLDEFLRRLRNSNNSIDDIRVSRIHLAILSIAGHGTRWPIRLIDRCDELRAVWEVKYGPLKKLGILLYEQGGRLYDICTPEDASKEILVAKWLKTPEGTKLSPVRSLRHGDLGFKPGDWWINPLFAFREGIINHSEAKGGTISDSIGAYAVVLAGSQEKSCSNANSFVYRPSNNDKGRYRLASGAPESRQPVRILRSHNLQSFLAPKAGLRYDGLHKVSGWSIKRDAKTKAMVYDIHFVRLPDQQPMEEVLCRPWTEEIEDYKEYKRLRFLVRDKKAEAVRSVAGALSTLAGSADGACDVDDVHTEASSSGDLTGDSLAAFEVTRARDRRPRRVSSFDTRRKNSDDDCVRSDSMFD